MSISNAEWEVMRVVWANPKVSAQEVYDILAQDQNWSLSTVKTLLGRLVKKAMLTVESRGRQFHYSACQSEQEANQERLRTLLDGICNKERGASLISLLKEVDLSQADLHQLQNLVDAKIQTAPQEVACHCLKGQCRCHHH